MNHRTTIAGLVLALTVLAAGCGGRAAPPQTATGPEQTPSAESTAPESPSASAEPSAAAEPSSPAAPSYAPTPGGNPVVDPRDGGNYAPTIDPANFVDTIDNPYFPLKPGARWVYEGEADGAQERVEVTVTQERRDIQGVSAVVVRDTVSNADGEVVEDTYDWYAQDRDGNVWYLGEDTSELEGGQVVSKKGSWEHGVNGAIGGIIMRATPTPGDAYRQEYYQGEAEDMAEVLETGGTRTTTLGDQRDVVLIEEWTPLEPDIISNKFYAPGIGEVGNIHVAGPSETMELVEFTPGS